MRVISVNGRSKQAAFIVKTPTSLLGLAPGLTGRWLWAQVLLFGGGEFLRSNWRNPPLAIRLLPVPIAIEHLEARLSSLGSTLCTSAQLKAAI